MPLVPMKQILDEAEKSHYGVGAFNMNNMEQLQAIMDAAVEKKSPVILQVSEGALEYSGMDALPAMLKAMLTQDKYKDVKVALHLDHGRTLEACKKAIDLGFTSVMYDGSLDATGKKQQGYQDNVRKTREVVEYAHKFGVTVEGELGALGGSDEQKAGKIEFTDPDQAGEFVRLTGVDCLAISIGTSHGAYKFVGEPKLDLDRVPKIKAKVGGVTLVMHGSSSVPREMVDAIDEYTIMRVTADERGDRWVSYKKGTPSIERTDKGDKPVIKFEDRKFKLPCWPETGINEMTPDIAMEMARDLEDNHRLARAMGVPTAMIQEAISGYAFSLGDAVDPENVSNGFRKLGLISEKEKVEAIEKGQGYKWTVTTNEDNWLIERKKREGIDIVELSSMSKHYHLELRVRQDPNDPNKLDIHAGGIRKINIDTDGRLAFTQAILQSLFEKPDNFDQRKYLGGGRDAIRVWVGREMEYFGSMGHNGDYQPLTIDDMKKQYSKTVPAMLSLAQVEDILAKQSLAAQKTRTVQKQ